VAETETNEPTMEEILASIKRIISEDDDPAAKAEPLQLSQPAEAPPEPEMDFMAEEPPPAAIEDDLMVFDVADEPEPVLPPMPRAPIPPMDMGEGLVDNEAAGIAAHAFGRLVGTMKLAEVEGQTIEGMMREILKPMLKDWLDANLPVIVENLVQSELDRISRRAR
jgi:uncharacterized protein